MDQSTSFADQYTVLQGRPFPKDPLSYFQDSKKTRVFLTITDQPSVWQKDLVLGERLFGDVVVCPYTTNLEEHSKSFQLTKDVLTQRSRYPGLTPELQQIANTWILPKKVHMGPEASVFLMPSEHAVQDALIPVYTTLKLETPQEQRIHVLKVEVSGGQERQLLYKLLDSGLRPSLLLVKWSHDLDDHISTAHCAGHIRNLGYSFVALCSGSDPTKGDTLEGDYALYMFTEQVLYDICSMKDLGLTNPIMDSLLGSVRTSSCPPDLDVTPTTNQNPTL
jgi:hypothetical protein